MQLPATITSTSSRSRMNPIVSDCIIPKRCSTLLAPYTEIFESDDSSTENFSISLPLVRIPWRVITGFSPLAGYRVSGRFRGGMLCSIRCGG